MPYCRRYFFRRFHIVIIAIIIISLSLLIFRLFLPFSLIRFDFDIFLLIISLAAKGADIFRWCHITPLFQPFHYADYYIRDYWRFHFHYYAITLSTFRLFRYYCHFIIDAIAFIFIRCHFAYSPPIFSFSMPLLMPFISLFHFRHYAYCSISLFAKHADCRDDASFSPFSMPRHLCRRCAFTLIVTPPYVIIIIFICRRFSDTFSAFIALLIIFIIDTPLFCAGCFSYFLAFRYAATFQRFLPLRWLPALSPAFAFHFRFHSMPLLPLFSRRFLIISPPYFHYWCFHFAFFFFFFLMTHTCQRQPFMMTFCFRHSGFHFAACSRPPAAMLSLRFRHDGLSPTTHCHYCRRHLMIAAAIIDYASADTADSAITFFAIAIDAITPASQPPHSH